MLPKVTCHESWLKPPVGTLKVNVDAAWINHKADLGFVVRDTDALCMGEACTLLRT